MTVARTPSPPDPHLPPAGSSANGRALRVLVAEDNRINQRLIVGLLRTLGHGGVVVPDGLQALQCLRQQTFDLLLLDVMMPELDGLATLARIRAAEGAGRRRLPVIMATAHDMPGDREAMLAAGADGYLAKPVDLTRLRTEIERVLHQH